MRLNFTGPYWSVIPPYVGDITYPYPEVIDPFPGCHCPECTKKRQGRIDLKVHVNLDAEKFHQQIDKVLQKLERAKLLKEEVFGFK
jgi:hypothetical protein